MLRSSDNRLLASSGALVVRNRVQPSSEAMFNEGRKALNAGGARAALSLAVDACQDGRLWVLARQAAP